MSTGADCVFREESPNKWFYDLQEWPYGETMQYETYGPFESYEEACEDLRANHANPGGHSIERFKS